MRRDLELVRRILLHLEGGEEGASPSGWSTFVDEGYELAQIHYHVRLLHDAGLIEADEIVPGQWWPERMTWAGHEFLDAARNDELWSEVKGRIERGPGTAPFLLFHELLIRLSRESLDSGGDPKRARSRRTRARSGTM
jgi:hypothetical protein